MVGKFSYPFFRPSDFWSCADCEEPGASGARRGASSSGWAAWWWLMMIDDDDDDDDEDLGFVVFFGDFFTFYHGKITIKKPTIWDDNSLLFRDIKQANPSDDSVMMMVVENLSNDPKRTFCLFFVGGGSFIGMWKKPTPIDGENSINRNYITGPRHQLFSWGYKFSAPINGRKQMGNWGLGWTNPTCYRRYFTPFTTGDGAYFVLYYLVGAYRDEHSWAKNG